MTVARLQRVYSHVADGGLSTNRHRVVVRNYSKDARITASGAQVAVVCGNQVVERVELSSKPKSNKEFWDVAALHGLTGKVKVINKLRSSIPRANKGLRNEPIYDEADMFTVHALVVDASAGNRRVTSAGAMAEIWCDIAARLHGPCVNGEATIDGVKKRWDQIEWTGRALGPNLVPLERLYRLPPAPTEIRIVTVSGAGEDELRFVLTWDAQPASLDLHVMCPNGEDISGANPDSNDQPVVQTSTCNTGYGAEAATLTKGKVPDWYGPLCDGWWCGFLALGS